MEMEFFFASNFGCDRIVFFASVTREFEFLNPQVAARTEVEGFMVMDAVCQYVGNGAARRQSE